MDAFEAIRTLLAVRSYQTKPVPDAVVHRILEAGRLTGSGMNRQPWHFVVVRNPETLKGLGALASSGPYIAQAPLAIVVATDKSRFAVSDARVKKALDKGPALGFGRVPRGQLLKRPLPVDEAAQQKVLEKREKLMELICRLAWLTGLSNDPIP